MSTIDAFDQKFYSIQSIRWKKYESNFIVIYFFSNLNHYKNIKNKQLHNNYLQIVPSMFKENK